MRVSHEGGRRPSPSTPFARTLPGGEEDVGALAQGSTLVTGGHLGIVHLTPLAMARSHVKKVVSSLTTPSEVHPHGIEHVAQWPCHPLRRVGLHVEALGMAQFLSPFGPAHLCEPLQHQHQDLGRAVQSQRLAGRQLPETNALVIGIFSVQLLGLHQLSQSLLHTLSRHAIQADVQIRVEHVQNTEAVETLDLRPPRPAEDLTHEGGVLGGKAGRLGCTQAPLLHGIQSEHQKLEGIFLLVSVEARQQVLAGPDHLARVKEGSGHVSSHATEHARGAGRTEGGVLLRHHPAVQGRRVSQTLQHCIHVAGIPQILKPSPDPARPPPTQGDLVGRRQPC